MKMKQLISSSFIGALALGLAQWASASPVLWVGDSGGTLGKVDVATGAVSLVGNMGRTMTDIAFDPWGNLYGITFGELYTIDKNTAAASFVGFLGTSLNSLVFDSAGTLYAANSGLFKVNTATGAASLVGWGSYASSGDLAFIGSDLFLSSAGGDTLVKINTATGAGTSVGNIGFSAVYGLATNNNVNLYGTTGTSVIGINTTTGAGSWLVNYAGQGLGVAFGSAFYEEACTNCNVPVPEPTGLGLMLVGLLGALGLRRKI